MSYMTAATGPFNEGDILRAPPGLPGGGPLVIPFALFRLISRIIWRRPGQGARKMAEFSHVEAGSGLDMLEATEACEDPILRKKYYLHAMDELKHAGMFRARAKAWSEREGGNRQAEAVLEDAAFIPAHGIRDAEPLYRQISELEFLAFVWLHERAGAAQFAVYAELMQGDAPSRAMFAEVARDERFHIAYSRAELERRAKAGAAWAVWRAVWAVRLRDLWQAWGRLAFRVGDFMSGLWLSLLYWAVVAPFALIARRSERLSGGFAGAGLEPGGRSGARGYAEQMI